MAHQQSAIAELVQRASAKLGKYQNTHAQSLLGTQNKLYNGVAGIAAMRSNPNSLLTPAANALQISRAANKLKDEAGKAKQSVNNIYAQYMISLDSSIAKIAGIEENQYASEIRAAFRALPGAKRMSALADVINTGNGAAFAALMFAPEIVTGIPTEQRIHLTNSFYLKVAPEQYQEQQDLKDAMECFDSTINTTLGICYEYNNPVEIRKIEQEVSKAQEASNKFNEAMG